MHSEGLVVGARKTPTRNLDSFKSFFKIVQPKPINR